MIYKQYKRPQKYKIYTAKRVYKPLNFKVKGWKKTKLLIEKLERKGIKCYAKKVRKGNTNTLRRF